LQQSAQSNKRQFFRINVELPVYLLPWERNTGEEGHSVCEIPSEINFSPAEILPSAKRECFSEEQQRLEALFANEKHQKNGAVSLFSGLNRRIEFLAWLFDQVSEGKDPSHSNEYALRMEQNRAFKAPELGEASRVGALISALDQRIHESIHILMAPLHSTAQTQLWFYDDPMPAPLSCDGLVDNLHTLAQNGNWLSQVLVALIAKLNIYEAALANLQAYSHRVPRPEMWPVYSANLSAGGMALHLLGDFELHEAVGVWLQLEQTVLCLPGRVVHVMPSDCAEEIAKQGEGLQRVAFEFVDLPEAQSAAITRFVTQQELAGAHRHAT
jgi:hypothetical protein